MTVPDQRLRFAVECDSIEQVLALLGLTKALGLNPHMGVANDLDHEALRKMNGAAAKRKYRKKLKAKNGVDTAGRPLGGKSGQVKPKRYSRFMLVRVAETPPPGLSARALEILAALRAEYGNDPFPKGRAKAVLRKRLKMNSPTGNVTMLVDNGGLVAAEPSG